MECPAETSPALPNQIDGNERDEENVRVSVVGQGQAHEITEG
jgi:hypothetical protein